MSPNVTITAATGRYEPSKSHADVTGFASMKTFHYSPRLNEVFPNLISIFIAYGMNELHQSNLKQYPRLKHNPDLEVIELERNKISRIHPTVFNHLEKLRILVLDDNVCINDSAYDRSAVIDLISRVKEACSDEPGQSRPE
jgi:hypothetical protein